ncbi:hypothetical protein C7N43_37830 [Sphingobacteriales bacterium UPWRP_1]|nr:hypothetical protein BVG80_17995 [Sphingobacteriales bacterium TSM_CSM]PSJ71738.1 hypothetical protein C7N43_37830 [Sphingobacteriales bacterium UPWRP_1]
MTASVFAQSNYPVNPTSGPVVINPNIQVNAICIMGTISGEVKVSKSINLYGKTAAQLKSHIQNNLSVYKRVNGWSPFGQQIANVTVSVTEAHTATDYVFKFSAGNLPKNIALIASVANLQLSLTASHDYELSFSTTPVYQSATITGCEFKNYNFGAAVVDMMIK